MVAGVEPICSHLGGVYTPRGREATRRGAADATGCGAMAGGRGGTMALGRRDMARRTR
jgi:hypothetical protein